jgi:hypothetical protein
VEFTGFAPRRFVTALHFTEVRQGCFHCCKKRPNGRRRTS